MAKVSLTKITPIKVGTIQTITIGNEDVEVKQYLPMADKASMVQEIMNEVLDEHGLSSILRYNIYFSLYFLRYYTNLNITDTMIFNAAKTYDSVVLNNVLDKVVAAVPEEEYNAIFNLTKDTINLVSNYRMSIAGLFFDMQSAQKTTVEDTSEIMKDLDQLSNNATLQTILSKLG